VRTSNICASIVNRFLESVCGHEQNRFVGTVEYAYNKKINAIKKRRGLSVHQTVVHLMKCVQAKKNATEESGVTSLSICCIFFNEQCRSESLLFFTASIPDR